MSNVHPNQLASNLFALYKLIIDLNFRVSNGTLRLSKRNRCYVISANGNDLEVRELGRSEDPLLIIATEIESEQDIIDFSNLVRTAIQT